MNGGIHLSAGCMWVWIGDMWTKQSDACAPGERCDEPSRTGNYSGDTETTNCHP